MELLLLYFLSSYPRGILGTTKMTRKVIDARADRKGNISHVKIEGNTNFTPVKTAMRMADRGELSNAHSVRRENAIPHLRTNPDGSRSNNLDNMAGDS